jgi:predicted acylesterase/phospholipase RssA
MHNRIPRTRFFQTCLGVFQGGGCRGAAFAGALAESEVRGVNFAGVAGTSAGSIVAALLGARATAAFIHTTLSRLDFLSLLRVPEKVTSDVSGLVTHTCLRVARYVLKEAATVWEYHGLHSSHGIEDWVNQQLHDLLPTVRGRVRFRDLPVPTYVVATDIISNDVKVWSSFATPDDEVAFAVRCSCSIPAFFQPVMGRYIDGGVLSNLPAFVFSGPDFAQNKPFANRILAFTLVASHEDRSPATGKELFKAAVSTIVDGASALQGRLVQSVHQIPISTGEIQATDFSSMNGERLTWLSNQGRDAARTFFDDELGRVQAAQTGVNLLSGDDEIYSALTEMLDDVGISHVVISDNQTRWAYAIFPTLLAWRSRGVRIQVILGSQNATGHELYRRRLMRALGADLRTAQSIPFRGFLLDPENEALARAILVAPELPGADDEIRAVRYQAPLDFPAIQAMWGSLRPTFQQERETIQPVLRISPVAERIIIEKLQRYVPAYATAGARLSMETVALRSMLSLTKLVRGYKFKQIQQLFDLFNRAGINCFDTAEVRYTDQLSTFVTPPVVEFTGGRFILVQGNTRALYSYRNGIEDLRCIVVRDHRAPLPSNQRIELSAVLIGGRTVSTVDRYGGNIDRDYRNIEWATHNPEETLLDVEL